MAEPRSQVFREAFRNLVYLREMVAAERAVTGAVPSDRIMRFAEGSNEIWRNRIMPLKDIGAVAVNRIAQIELASEPTNIVALLGTVETAALAVQQEYRDVLLPLVAITGYTIATGAHTWSNITAGQRSAFNSKLDDFIAACDAVLALA